MSNKKKEKLDQCEICSKKFSMILPQHTCKRCLRAVCSDCKGSEKLIIVRLLPQDKDKHYPCRFCLQDINSQKKIREEQKLIFAEDSLIGERWIKMGSKLFRFLNLFQRVKIDQIQAFYQQALNFDLTEKPDDAKVVEAEIGKFRFMFDEERRRINYSWSDTLYFLTEKIDIKVQKARVERVIQAFLNTHPQFGFQIDMIHLVLFLLCHLSESSSYYLFSTLYTSILPDFMAPLAVKQNQSWLQEEIDHLITILKSSYKIPQTDEQYYQAFLKKRYVILCQGFCTRGLCYESYIAFFETILTEQNFYTVQNCVALMCFLTSKYLQDPDPEVVIDAMLKQTTVFKVREYLQQQVDDNMKEISISRNMKMSANKQNATTFEQKYYLLLKEHETLQSTLEEMKNSSISTEADNKEDPQFLKQQITQLQLKFSESQVQLKAYTSENKDLKQQIEKLLDENNSLLNNQEKLDQVISQNNQIQSIADLLSQENQELKNNLEQSLKEQQDMLAERKIILEQLKVLEESNAKLNQYKQLTEEYQRKQEDVSQEYKNLQETYLTETDQLKKQNIKVLYEFEQLKSKNQTIAKQNEKLTTESTDLKQANQFNQDSLRELNEKYKVLELKNIDLLNNLKQTQSQVEVLKSDNKRLEDISIQKQGNSEETISVLQNTRDKLDDQINQNQTLKKQFEELRITKEKQDFQLEGLKKEQERLQLQLLEAQIQLKNLDSEIGKFKTIVADQEVQIAELGIDKEKSLRDLESNQNQQSEIERLRQQNHENQNQISNQENILKQRNKQIQDLQEQINLIQTSNQKDAAGKIQIDMEKKNNQIKELQKTINELEFTIKGLKETSEDLTIARQILEGKNQQLEQQIEGLTENIHEVNDNMQKEHERANLAIDQLTAENKKLAEQQGDPNLLKKFNELKAMNEKMMMRLNQLNMETVEQIQFIRKYQIQENDVVLLKTLLQIVGTNPSPLAKQIKLVLSQIKIDQKRTQSVGSITQKESDCQIF